MRHLERLLVCDRKKLIEISERAGSFYEPFDRQKFGTEKWRHIDNPTDRLKIQTQSIHVRVTKDPYNRGFRNVRDKTFVMTFPPGAVESKINDLVEIQYADAEADFKPPRS